MIPYLYEFNLLNLQWKNGVSPLNVHPFQMKWKTLWAFKHVTNQEQNRAFNMETYENMKLDDISKETDAPLVININDGSNTCWKSNENCNLCVFVLHFFNFVQ